MVHSGCSEEPEALGLGLEDLEELEGSELDQVDLVDLGESDLVGEASAVSALEVLRDPEKEDLAASAPAELVEAE